jgi:hypothetical protein
MSFDISLIKDEKNNFSRNVEHQSPSDAVLHPRRSGFLTSPLRKTITTHHVLSSSVRVFQKELYKFNDNYN